MSNIIIQGNEINAKEYVEKITIEGIGEEKSLNPRLIVAKGGNSMINYSTEEQVIGTWIDGKPLYQRVIHVQNKQFDGNGNYTIDLSSENMDIILPMQNGYYDFYINTTRYVRSLIASIEDKLLYIKSGYPNRSISNAYQIIQYTKTTD